MGMNGKRKQFVFVYFVMEAITVPSYCKPFIFEKVAGLGVLSKSSNNGSVGLKKMKVSLCSGQHTELPKIHWQ